MISDIHVLTVCQTHISDKLVIDRSTQTALPLNRTIFTLQTGLTTSFAVNTAF